MKRILALVLALLSCVGLLSGCGGPDPADPGGSAQSGASASSEGSAQDQPAGPNVRADWSRLEGREKAAQPDRDGGRWYASYTGELIPGPDYGELIPFVGAQVYNFNEYEYQGQPQAWYSNWPNPLYGLMTREGRIVVDPVYNSAYGANWYWQGKNHPCPF